MANNKVVVNFDFKANTQDIKTQLNNLKISLQNISNATSKGLINKDLTLTQFVEIKNAARDLGNHLRKATDPMSKGLDLTRLQTSLKAANQDVTKLSLSLLKGGQQGQQAFLNLASAITSAQAPMMRTSALMTKMWTTFANNARWMISSAVLTGFTSAMSEGVQYAKDLNESLTNIRIVTGKTKEEMEGLVNSSAKMAKQLKSTTLDIIKGQLIYYQQGDSAALAAKKAEITTKAANVSFGSSQEQMSEYLTAIWNSYQVGEDQLEEFVDVLAAVGATTATSMEEIAVAMQKVAATGNAVGVSYEQLTATIATISSVTRTSSEQVGTALKTVYARIGDLKAGGLDEDDIGLGQVSSGLKKVGVEILDAQNNIRDMGEVVEEIGTKWEGWTEAQQQAIVQLIAGKRQYTQMMALFENWGMYESTLATAKGADGELNKQQEIWAESWEGASNRVSEAVNTLYEKIFDDDAFIGMTNVLADLIGFFNGFIDSIGGIGPLLLNLGVIFTTVFHNQLTQGLRNVWFNVQLIGTSIMTTFGLATPAVQTFHDQLLQLTTTSAFQQLSVDAQEYVKNLLYINSAQMSYDSTQKRMSEEQKLNYQEQINTLKTLNEQMMQNRQTQQTMLADLTKGQTTKTANSVNNYVDSQASKRAALSTIRDEKLFEKYGKTMTLSPERANTAVASDSKDAITVQKALSAAYGETSAQATAFNQKMQEGTLTEQDMQNALRGLTGELDKQTQAKLLNTGETEKGSKTDQEFTAIVDKLTSAETKAAAAKRDAANASLKRANEAKREQQALVQQEIELLKTQQVEETDKTKKAKLGLEIEKLILKEKELTNSIKENEAAMNSNNDEYEKEVQDIRRTAAAAMEGAISEGEAAEKKQLEIQGKSNLIRTDLKNIGVDGASQMMFFSTAAMAVSSTVTGISSAVRTLTDDTASLGDKFSAIIGTASSVAMSFVSLAMQASAMGTTIGQMFAALWGSLIPLLPYIGAIGAVVGIIYLAVKANKAAEEQAEKAQKAMVKAQEAAAEANKQYTELKNNIADYKSAQEGLDALREGTDAFKSAVIEANQKVLELIQKYPELHKFMSVGDNGRLQISEEGFLRLEEYGNNTVLNSMLSMYEAQLNNNQAQLELKQNQWDDVRRKANLRKEQSYLDKAQEKAQREFLRSVEDSISEDESRGVVKSAFANYKSDKKQLNLNAEQKALYDKAKAYETRDYVTDRLFDDKIVNYFKNQTDISAWNDLEQLSRSTGIPIEGLEEYQIELMELSQATVDNTNEMKVLNKNFVQENNKDFFEKHKLSKSEQNYLSKQKSDKNLTDKQIEDKIQELGYYNSGFGLIGGKINDDVLNDAYTDYLTKTQGGKYKIVKGSGDTVTLQKYNGSAWEDQGELSQTEMSRFLAKQNLSEISEEDIKQMEEQKKLARFNLTHYKFGGEQDLSQAKSISESDLKDFEQLYLQFLSGDEMDLSSFTQEELSEIEKLIDESQLDDKFKKQFKLEKKDYKDDVFEAQAAGAKQFSQALEKAGKAIEKIKNATKEIDDDGFLSYSTIEEIGKSLEDMGVSADEWKNKLYVANGTAQETKEVLGQIGIAIAQNTASAQDWSLAIDGNTVVNQKLVDSTKAQIVAQLRELGIQDAENVAHAQVTAAIVKEMVARGENTDEIQEYIEKAGLSIEATNRLQAMMALLAYQEGKLTFSQLITSLDDLKNKLGEAAFEGIKEIAVLTSLKQLADSGLLNDKNLVKKDLRIQSDPNKPNYGKVAVENDIVKEATAYANEQAIVETSPEWRKAYNDYVSKNYGSAAGYKWYGKGSNLTPYIEDLTNDAFEDLMSSMPEYDPSQFQTTYTGDGGGGSTDPAWKIEYENRLEQIEYEAERDGLTKLELGRKLRELYNEYYGHMFEIEDEKTGKTYEKYFLDKAKNVISNLKDGLTEAFDDEFANAKRTGVYDYAKLSTLLSDTLKQAAIEGVTFSEEEKNELIDTYVSEVQGLMSEASSDLDTKFGNQEFFSGIINLDEKMAGYDDLLKTAQNYLKDLENNEATIEQLAEYENSVVIPLIKKKRDLLKEEADAAKKATEHYIKMREFYGYENGDNEIKARERTYKRMLNLTQEQILAEYGTYQEYWYALEEERLEIDQIFRDKLKEALEKEKDDRIAILEAEKNAAEKLFEGENTLREKRKQINDQLQESLTMYQYLDKATRKLIFNEEDYLALSNTLNEIEEDMYELNQQYLKDIVGKEADELEYINAEYERQNELLMNRYEIAEKELNIIKARTELENTIKERNTQMFINGRWQWVADQKAVIEAQKKLNDAEFDLETSELENEQELLINSFEKQIDDANQAWEKATKVLEDKVMTVAELMGSLSEPMDDLTAKFYELATGKEITSRGEQETEKQKSIENAESKLAENMALAIIRKKEEYDAAKAQGDMTKAQEIEEQAKASYQVLQDLGYNELAEELHKSDLATAKKLNLDELTAKKKQTEETTEAIAKGANKVANAILSKSNVKSSSGGGGGDTPTVPGSNPNHNNATATIPGVGTVGVRIENGKTTTTKLPVGTVVHTAGGDFKITGGTGGNYTSVQVKSANAEGSRSVIRGLGRINEIGEETFVTPDGHFRNFAGGEVVFTHEQSQRLFSLLNADLFDINKMPRVGEFEQSNSNDTYISIGGISIDTTTQDGKDLVEILQRITNI